MRLWWVFAGLAAVSAAGLLRLVLLGDLSRSGDREQLVAATVSLFLWGAIAIVLALHARRGPRPPLHAVVVREGATPRMRIMLDPVSSIRESRPRRRVGERGPRQTASILGTWYGVTWRSGHAPQVARRSSVVSVRREDDGRVLPQWTPAPLKERPGAHQEAVRLLREAAAEDATIHVSSREMVRVIDAVALRSGWSSEADVRGARRRFRHEERHEARGRHAPEVPAVGPSPGFEGPARVLRWIGAAVLLACLLATGIGLLAGMVWWASFIILGSGLLFCVLFVLPFQLIARAERPPPGCESAPRTSPGAAGADGGCHGARRPVTVTAEATGWGDPTAPPERPLEEACPAIQPPAASPSPRPRVTGDEPGSARPHRPPRRGDRPQRRGPGPLRARHRRDRS